MWYLIIYVLGFWLTGCGLVYYNKNKHYDEFDGFVVIVLSTFWFVIVPFVILVMPIYLFNKTLKDENSSFM